MRFTSCSAQHRLGPFVVCSPATTPVHRKAVVKGFRVVHVFDIADTEGDDLPGLANINGEPGDNLQRLEQVLKDLDIELEYGGLPPNHLGMSLDGKILIRETLSETEKISVGVHELAHELLHKGVKKEGTTKSSREAEAEATAFVVCEALGIDTATRSADYLTLYQGSAEHLSTSLDAIQKTAKAILDHLGSVDVDSCQVQEVSTPETKCDHTIHAIIDGGEITGSWKIVDRDGKAAVVCEHCDRFYGYMPPKKKGEENPEEEAEPVYRVGRADYEERREARIERYQERAERNQELANATHDRARQMASAIPFGQPILVGHHSETRDRNYRDRIHQTFGKSFELQDKAKHYRSLELLQLPTDIQRNVASGRLSRSVRHYERTLHTPAPSNVPKLLVADPVLQHSSASNPRMANSLSFSNGGVSD